MILFLLVQLAGAVDLTVSASAGYDQPTQELWSGLEVALLPTNDHGVSPLLRLAPAYGFIDGKPMLLTEAGLVFVLPEDEAILRFGLHLRGVAMVHTHPFPIQGADRNTSRGTPHPGLVPGIMASVEFEWAKKHRFTAGVKAGVSSGITDQQCDIGENTDRCIQWRPDLVGGFYGRFRFEKGPYFEVVMGPTASLSAGWAFGAVRAAATP